MSRRHRRRDHDDSNTALANFALTFAKALLVLCVIMFVLVSPEKTAEDGVKPKAEAVIMVDWPKEAMVDVDTWVRTPQGKIVYFRNKESGIVFLDRDDLGNECVTVCEEIVSLRGLQTGEFVLNLNVYHANIGVVGREDGQPLKEPLTVHVKLIQMNPSVTIIWEADVVLTVVKEERHVVRFRIDNGRLNHPDDSHPVMLQSRL